MIFNHYYSFAIPYGPDKMNQNKRKFKKFKRTPQLTSLKRQVRYLSRSREQKFHDVSLSAAPGTTPAVIELTGIAQGDTQLERSGNSIQPFRAQLSYYIKPPASSAGDDFYRVLIVQDNRYSGTLLTATDVLERGTSATVNDFKEVNTAVRNAVHIIYDKVHSLSPGSAYPNVQKSWSLKSKTKCMFDGTTGASEAHGCYYALVIALDNTNKATLVGEWRLTYEDA